MAKRASNSRLKRSNRNTKAGYGAPFGVKIVSVLSYVISFALLVMGIFIIWYGVFLSEADAERLLAQFVEDSTASTTIASNLTLGLTFGGIICLAFAALMFFVGRGLLRGKKWARIVMVVFAAIGFVGALADVIRGDILNNLFDLVVDGWIAGYLLFDRKVQKMFD